MVLAIGFVLLLGLVNAHSQHTPSPCERLQALRRINKPMRFRVRQRSVGGMRSASASFGVFAKMPGECAGLRILTGSSDRSSRSDATRLGFAILLHRG
jgi:hypothetical protein